MTSPFSSVCCAVMLFLLLSVGGSAAGADGPEACGPVPAFTSRTLGERLHEEVFVELEYPHFGLPFPDEDVRRRVHDFEDEYFVRPPVIEKDENGEVMSWQRSLSYKLYASKPGIVSVVFSGWMYDEGMPHGLAPVEARTYDLGARKILRLEDVFPDWVRAQRRLPALIRKYMDSIAEQEYGIHDNAGKGKGGLCPDIDPDMAFARDTVEFSLDSYGMALWYTVPIDQWGVCNAVSIDKDDLEEAGADMRYWKP